MSEQSLREDVDDLRAWVAMQHEAAGLDSSDQAAGEFHAHKRVLGHLHKILAAHPPEPAPVVTDEAVEGGAKAFWDYQADDSADLGPWPPDPEKSDDADLTRRFVRIVLEAAAPLLAPQPVVDREALVKAIDNAGALEVGGTNWPLDRKNVQEIADAVLALINGGGPEARNREDDLLPHEKGAGLYRGWGAAK